MIIEILLYSLLFVVMVVVGGFGFLLLLSMEDPGEKKRRLKEAEMKKAEAEREEAREKARQQERNRAKEVEAQKFYGRKWTLREAQIRIDMYREETEKRYIYETNPSLWNLNESTEELHERILYLQEKQNELAVHPEEESALEAPPVGIVIGTRPSPLAKSDPIRYVTRPVALPESARDRDLYVVGKKRTGKSTLLLNLACHDIRQGDGVAVIDPHGDLVEELLEHIPRERVNDTIYFDASDTLHPIPLSVFNARGEEEVARLADDLIVVFKRLSESWGDRMENILRYTFHTLLRAEGTTFLDIQTILQDSAYRERILSQIDAAPLLDFWRHQFPHLPKDATQPILSRMSRFILSPVLSAILSGGTSNLDFFEVIEGKKIFLANISEGKIGEDTSKLLGSLLVSQFQLAIMRRAHIAKEDREQYFLYVDEFQNFTSSAFDKILSEAGKYKLSLTLAHQYISQLDDRIRSAILGNVGSMLLFPLGLEDARLLRGELGYYGPDDLANLDINQHEALYRPATGAKDTVRINMLPPPARPANHFASAIIDSTHEKYRRNGSARERSSIAIPNQSVPTRAARPRKQNVSPAAEKEFATNKERALYFIGYARYLSTRQIIGLCYGHIAQSAQATTASRDLRQLVREKKLKEQFFGKEKIYSTTGPCDPTKHNLGIRDLFLKILASPYEVAEADFTRDLKELKPDLFVSFLSKNGALIKSFWEYDTGTEGVGEIVKKVRRYHSYSRDHLITIVVTQRKRLSQLRSAVKEPFITFVMMQDLQSLDDSAFQSSENENGFPFFT